MTHLTAVAAAKNTHHSPDLVFAAVLLLELAFIKDLLLVPPDLPGSGGRRPGVG